MPLNEEESLLYKVAQIKTDLNTLSNRVTQVEASSMTVHDAVTKILSVENSLCELRKVLLGNGHPEEGIVYMLRFLSSQFTDHIKVHEEMKKKSEEVKESTSDKVWDVTKYVITLILGVVLMAIIEKIKSP